MFTFRERIFQRGGNKECPLMGEGEYFTMKVTPSSHPPPSFPKERGFIK